jgi:hypothetical protein
MSIQLKINKKIDLKAPKFLCDDNPLGILVVIGKYAGLYPYDINAPPCSVGPVKPLLPVIPNGPVIPVIPNGPVGPVNPIVPVIPVNPLFFKLRLLIVCTLLHVHSYSVGKREPVLY